MEFYNATWKEIGTKWSLKATLYEITGIDIRVLEGATPLGCNVAHRLSWASTRTTTRVEDMAYSLMGLFDINMPLLYGEGINAFKRLQEEILKTLKDYTLFAWRDHDGLPFGDGILAPSPVNFCRPSSCSACGKESGWTYRDPLSRPFENVIPSLKLDFKSSGSSSAIPNSGDLPTFMTGRLRMTLPISVRSLQQPASAEPVLAYLGYRNGKDGSLLCLQLGPDWEDTHDFYRNPLIQIAQENITYFKLSTVVLVSWRNMAGESKPLLRDSLKYRFVHGHLPPCLSVFDCRLPGDQPLPREQSSVSWKQLFNNFQSTQGVTLYNGTWAAFLLKHEHTGLDGKAECIEEQFGPILNMPMCAMKIGRLNKLSDSYPEWAEERIWEAPFTDRVKLLVCSGRRMLFASTKRQPTTDPSMPRFCVQITCKVMA